MVLNFATELSFFMRAQLNTNNMYEQIPLPEYSHLKLMNIGATLLSNIASSPHQYWEQAKFGQFARKCKAREISKFLGPANRSLTRLAEYIPGRRLALCTSCDISVSNHVSTQPGLMALMVSYSAYRFVHTKPGCGPAPQRLNTVCPGQYLQFAIPIFTVSRVPTCYVFLRYRHNLLAFNHRLDNLFNQGGIAIKQKPLFFI